MERLIFLSLMFVASALAADFNPRGTRPVQPATRSEKCDTEKEWPFCTSDNWGPKCPSGCRIQGLMDKDDHDLLKKIEKIRSLLEQNKANYRNADHNSKETFTILRERLTIDADHDNNYFDLAQSLRQRITDMKIKIDRQLSVLAALKDRVKDQVVEMQRLEVDIDIKLRSCKGSCQSYSEYNVDKDSYVELDKQINQLDAQSGQRIESVGSLSVMKSTLLKDSNVETLYKSKDTTVAAQQREDMFPDVNTVQLILEEEGSSSSPATISKVPGTSLSSSASSSSSIPSSSSASSSSSSSSSSTSTSTSTSTSSKSITELGGSDFSSLGGVSTSHITCTKRTRTTTIHTKDGPVEKTEEVIEGGPECQSLADHFTGGTSSLSHKSSSSSSSTTMTKTVHSGDAKGSLLGDTKTGFGDLFGSDISAFLTDPADDDLPDFHARSLTSTRTERHADYIGKDCVQAHRNHLKGESNGLFKIKPGGTDSTQVVEVYCQQEGLMGGWLLVQQRESGALSFNRTWAEYRNGFGSIDAKGKGEFWLGNQNLHLLTNQGETILKVEMEDWEGGVASAEYTVRVGSEVEGYQLHVSGYTGDAGDALIMPNSDMASYLSHSGMKFSTFDKDNDKWEESCAEMYGGGWWYNNCQAANLNGIYYKGTYDPEKNTPYEIENGVVWATYKPANYSLKTVRMFIRSAAF
ncbi:hypothetical protein ABVT39_010008 [Epinephelus coioides]